MGARRSSTSSAFGARTKDTDGDSVPDGVLLFSVVVPTYNRPGELRRCLLGLTQLDYPRDRFEVIVVDDGSAPPLPADVAQAAGDLQLVLLRQQNAGAAAARNAGAARARGRYLVFIDDDCTPSPNWLSTLAAHFDARPECLVGGRVVNALPDRPCANANQMLLDYLYGHYNADPENASFLASMNIAMPGARFIETGGFDTTFAGAGGEDREFCERWRLSGLPVLYNPEVTIHHAHDLTLRAFWRQQCNYGKGAYRFRAIRDAGRARGQGDEPISFYRDLLLYPLRNTPFPLSIRLFLLICVSQVAIAYGYCYERFGEWVGSGLRRRNKAP